MAMNLSAPGPTIPPGEAGTLSGAGERFPGSRGITDCGNLHTDNRLGGARRPWIKLCDYSLRVKHRLTESKIDDGRLFHGRWHSMDKEKAVALPMAAAKEAPELIAIRLEGSVG
jgi:hypothetical protein